ncbi:cobalamin biosynthesis protein CobD [Kroppenstedtia guangzhouensis]|jgi:adenosylcobinamide-phosphate synthase|uniref:Cobalamin biosynthesis protein CobD n=1 Tax=Kroppenstedtia guangzhouensis TaxID=1274356 RepID=A0ABQ1GFU2_9BACL|nr:adenosylcobinamide-phosphate synthase CbiB [Kroppenstedtia guangzhouensis]GGA42818.1 cobalamin biosynthesis protein CobD [Kroppenstedtia guangzhouensis]
MIPAFTLLLACAVDSLVGDPRHLPHPVVGMGWLITRVEGILRRVMESLREGWSIRLLGCLLPATVLGTVYTVSYFLLAGVESFSWWAARLLEVWMISTTIAVKGLADAGRGIFHALEEGDLPGARRALSMVVGRDTDQLEEPEVVRGAVETVAENIVDAVTSPLFYAALGGAPLALAYRAVNTLDSMVGYKDEQYRDLGWASARLDDLANWVPARLTILPMLAALALKGHSARRAWRILQRDARKHPSPNSGITESLMAGGLGIQLGGENRYRGILSRRATLGDSLCPKTPDNIREAVGVLILCSWLFAWAAAFFCYTVEAL